MSDPLEGRVDTSTTATSMGPRKRQHLQDQDPLRLDSDIKEELFFYHQSQSTAAAVENNLQTGNGDISTSGMPQVDLLRLQPLSGQHVSLGRLPLDLLTSYVGPGMEWRRFLTICSASGEAELYLFDIGRVSAPYSF